MAHNQRETYSPPTSAAPNTDSSSGGPSPAPTHPVALPPPDAKLRQEPTPAGWSMVLAMARSWLQANTFVPTWLPRRWRHPAAGYVLALLVQVAVAVFTRLLVHFVPTYAFPGAVEILAVGLIAVTWGAGPGVFAALVGLALEETIVLPAFSGEGPLTGGDVIEGLVFMSVGICLSLVASTTERSRRRAVEEQTAAAADAAQAREAALRQTQEHMDEFVATASHDLRSPLAAACGFNELAALRFERLGAAVVGARPDLAGPVEAVRTSVQEAGQQVERVARLVELLFDTTQVHAGKIELRRQPCDLAAVVRTQVMALRMANPSRTLQFAAPAPAPPADAGPEDSVPHGGSVLVVADADRIGQVVTNYVTNALKYSPQDQPVAVAVQVRQYDDGLWACVSVADHGPGLPASEQERIWERFYRVAGVRTQREAGAGLGLGLHISRAIIVGHGGKVGLQSEEGKGSTFWFALPVANESSAIDA